jgi:hypothetical protein
MSLVASQPPPVFLGRQVCGVHPLALRQSCTAISVLNGMNGGEMARFLLTAPALLCKRSDASEKFPRLRWMHALTLRAGKRRRSASFSDRNAIVRPTMLLVLYRIARAEKHCSPDSLSSFRRYWGKLERRLCYLCMFPQMSDAVACRNIRFLSVCGLDRRR